MKVLAGQRLLKEMLRLLEQPPTQREEALHIQCLVIESVAGKLW